MEFQDDGEESGVGGTHGVAGGYGFGDGLELLGEEFDAVDEGGLVFFEGGLELDRGEGVDLRLEVLGPF